MTSFHHALLDVTKWCLQLVGLAWLGAAAYFAIRRPGPVRRRILDFLVTLLPEPWLLAAIPVLVALLRAVPQAVWRHLQFWNPLAALLGTVCVVAASALMLWARWVLGAMWAGRPLVQREHDLQTSGPYGLVRHPIYTGILGMALGATLVSGSGQAAAILLSALLFVWWRVRAEERLMAATFGDRYADYRRRVPALVPLRLSTMTQSSR
jgi:protein-S-isoprenylcysteine O-methyltransferase Ste14